MVPVASLLNPTPPSSERFRDYQIHTFKKDLKQSSSLLAPLKKQKMSKAAATFVKGQTRGPVNYPPYEIQDEATAAEHERFEVQPVGQIGEYPKRIPYNSEKKTFQQKTGMDGFEGMYHHLKVISNKEKLIHDQQSSNTPSECLTMLEIRMHIL